MWAKPEAIPFVNVMIQAFSNQSSLDLLADSRYTQFCENVSIAGKKSREVLQLEGGSLPAKEKRGCLRSR